MTRPPAPAGRALGPARDRAGRVLEPVHEMQCVTCEQACRPDTDHAALERWAVQHTASTGHGDFFLFTTARRTVTPPAGPAPAGRPGEQKRRVAR